MVIYIFFSVIEKYDKFTVRVIYERRSLLLIRTPRLTGSLSLNIKISKLNVKKSKESFICQIKIVYG
jgi:hypothetical protein